MSSEEKVIAFGDIHGCPQAARVAVELAEREGARVVFLGDYVDKGPDSAGVLEIMMQASEKHEDWVFLLGNHDLMLMNVMNGVRDPNGYDKLTAEVTYPLLKASFVRARLKQLYKWLEKRPVLHKLGDCLFVHGGFRKSKKPIEKRSVDELIWEYGIPNTWKGELVIRGHQPTETPSIGQRDININTMCGYGGYLTGMSIQTGTATPKTFWKISEGGILRKWMIPKGTAHK